MAAPPEAGSDKRLASLTAGLPAASAGRPRSPVFCKDDDGAEQRTAPETPVSSPKSGASRNSASPVPPGGAVLVPGNKGWTNVRRLSAMLAPSAEQQPPAATPGTIRSQKDSVKEKPIAVARVASAVQEVQKQRTADPTLMQEVQKLREDLDARLSGIEGTLRVLAGGATGRGGVGIFPSRANSLFNGPPRNPLLPAGSGVWDRDKRAAQAANRDDAQSSGLQGSRERRRTLQSQGQYSEFAREPSDRGDDFVSERDDNLEPAPLPPSPQFGDNMSRQLSREASGFEQQQAAGRILKVSSGFQQDRESRGGSRSSAAGNDDNASQGRGTPQPPAAVDLALWDDEAEASALFLPDSWFVTIFEFIYMAFSVVEATVITATIPCGMTDDAPATSTISMHAAATLWYAMHIVVVFRTAVLVGWQLIDDDPAVARSFYVARNGWFAFDLLITIPWDLLWLLMHVYEQGLDVYELYYGLRLLRIVRLLRLNSLFKVANPLAERRYTKGLLLLVAAISLHFVAAAHYAARGCDGGWDMREYVLSLYWAVQTVTSVGYGDATSDESEMRWLAIAVMLAGFMASGLFIGHMSVQIGAMDHFGKRTKEQKGMLMSLMTRYDVPLKIQKEAFGVMPLIFGTASSDFAAAFGMLPPFMQDKISILIRLKLLKQVPMFAGAEVSILRLLALRLDQHLVDPATDIIAVGEVGKEMYFISTGAVEVCVPDPTAKDGLRQVIILRDGCWFGEIAILKETRRTALVRTVTACDLYVLKKEDFWEILTQHPNSRFENAILYEVERRLQATPASRLRRESRAVGGASLEETAGEVVQSEAGSPTADGTKRQLAAMDVRRRLTLAVESPSPTGGDHTHRKVSLLLHAVGSGSEFARAETTDVTDDDRTGMRRLSAQRRSTTFGSRLMANATIDVDNMGTTIPIPRQRTAMSSTTAESDEALVFDRNESADSVARFRETIAMLRQRKQPNPNEQTPSTAALRNSPNMTFASMLRAGTAAVRLKSNMSGSQAGSARTQSDHIVEDKWDENGGAVRTTSANRLLHTPPGEEH